MHIFVLLYTGSSLACSLL